MLSFVREHEDDAGFAVFNFSAQQRTVAFGTGPQRGAYVDALTGKALGRRGPDDDDPGVGLPGARALTGARGEGRGGLRPPRTGPTQCKSRTQQTDWHAEDESPRQRLEAAEARHEEESRHDQTQPAEGLSCPTGRPAPWALRADRCSAQRQIDATARRHEQQLPPRRATMADSGHMDSAEQRFVSD